MLLLLLLLLSDRLLLLLLVLLSDRLLLLLLVLLLLLLLLCAVCALRWKVRGEGCLLLAASVERCVDNRVILKMNGRALGLAFMPCHEQEIIKQ